jgi:hypothetical protein
MLMKNAKDTVKLGVVSMAGMGLLGSLSKIPNMPIQAGTITKTAGAGLALANVGQLAKTGTSIVNPVSHATNHKDKVHGMIKKII